MDNVPWRTVVIGQEYGDTLVNVSLAERYAMIIGAGLLKRFTKSEGCETRTKHLKGTTSILKLLYGQDLEPRHDNEFLSLKGERIHIFDCFALVNYLLCSALDHNDSSRGLATSTMKENCAAHFRAVLKILEPTVMFVEGKSFWPWIKNALDEVREESEYLYSGTLAEQEITIAVLAHPSAPPYGFWGQTLKSKYLQEVVVPTVQQIRSTALGG